MYVAAHGLVGALGVDGDARSIQLADVRGPKTGVVVLAHDISVSRMARRAWLPKSVFRFWLPPICLGICVALASRVEDLVLPALWQAFAGKSAIWRNWSLCCA